MQTTPATLLHRLLRAHPLLIFDAQSLVNYPEVDSDDTWTLACEALTDDAEYLPRLLDLSDLSADDANKVLSALDERDSLSAPPLLLGDIVPGADLGRWALTQVTQAPDGSKHWLRWHDVRVWVNLLWIATPEQIAHLIGPARSAGWYWQGQWYQTILPSTITRTAPLAWTTEQWQSIQSIGVINRVFSEVGPPAASELPALARQVVQADAQANTMTLWDMPSRVAFACHQLKCGQGFWQAAPLRPIMTAVATREATYAEATAAQDEAFWHAVSAALAQAA
ncbi:MAG: hypothetical protein V4532_06045 [Pseudomonadota bacterium]